MTINDVAGKWMYHDRVKNMLTLTAYQRDQLLLLLEFLGHNSVSGLRTVKPKKTKKN